MKREIEDKLCLDGGLRPTRIRVQPCPPNEMVIDVSGKFVFPITNFPRDDAEVLPLLKRLHKGIHRAFPDADIKKNDVELKTTDDGALFWVATLDWDMSRSCVVHYAEDRVAARSAV